MEKKSLGAEDGEEAVAMEMEARPCSLLQYILRACAGCLLGVCGNPSSAPRPGADADADADPAPTAADQDGAEGGGKTAKDFPAGPQVLLAGRRKAHPKGPGNPREGRGGGGGSHS